MAARLCRRLSQWRLAIWFVLLTWAGGRLATLLLDQTGATGDIKLAYAASSNEATLTALNSLATSSTWTLGWGSTAIDNSSTLYEDFRVTAKITVGSSPTAGEIRMYLVGMLDDSTWPACASAGTIGTVGGITIIDTEMRDAIFFLAAVTAVDTGASDVYYLDCPSVSAVFGGNLPHKFQIFITHNLVQALASSGQQVTVKGSYHTVAS